MLAPKCLIDLKSNCRERSCPSAEASLYDMIFKHNINHHNTDKSKFALVTSK